MASSETRHSRVSDKLIYWSATVYAIVCAIAIASENLFLLGIPVALAIVLLAIYRMDLMLLLCVALTPFSLNLQQTSIGIGVSLPSEPLMFGLLLIFLARQLFYRDLDKSLLLHPVSIAILLHLAWMLVSSITSTMPLVSLKATLARICFVGVFFYLTATLFKQKEKINLFIWCYTIPLLGVIFYTTTIHAIEGFTEKAAHWAMSPFYNDHTAYAAVIAMFIPVMLGFIDDQSKSKRFRITCFFVLSVMVGAIVLSYTRAAWVSLVAALLCYLVFALRIKTSIVVGAAFAFVALVLLNWTTIQMELERNEEQSSTDYASHVQSVSNITTDASNVERINRWGSAIRMFAEKPILGWGPGTYMFQYAPFQKFSERTIISTNFGEGGNAHSEYIGALAEQGILGSLFFILILLVVVYRASRIIIHSQDRQVRLATKGLLLGLVTYWVHGTLNNFLDTEKASVPYWGFIAAIVALDLYHSRKTNLPKEKQLS
ncbi:MAG: O-antigen ligase family protein [Bacteroidota bacterium]